MMTEKQLLHLLDCKDKIRNYSSVWVNNKRPLTFQTLHLGKNIQIQAYI